MSARPTHDTYTQFDRAYDYFNDALFAGNLPSCVITMQRHRKAYGYFHGSTWIDAKGKTITDEIAMNPDKFGARSTAETLSTLVHEMCHLWQHHFGKPSRGRYHNKEWAAKMEEVGLIPSDTGEAGGRKTGEKVSHYIQPEGPFERACSALSADGFTVPWMALTDSEEETQRQKAKRASKTKYACLSCGTNIWGKPGVRAACADCNEMFMPMANPVGGMDEQEGANDG
jgi:predicted SprT family Zn-dependent metalloprotease